MALIAFYNADVKINFRNRLKLKRFIAFIFEKEEVLLDKLMYIFCSDFYLLSLNKRFLQHDYYTDILTFDLSDSEKVIGEIYISIDRIKENAGIENQFFIEELHRVLFHGALHLCGYKDDTIQLKKLMSEKENEYLGFYKSFT